MQSDLATLRRQRAQAAATLRRLRAEIATGKRPSPRQSIRAEIAELLTIPEL
jgi:hypothetical protein